MVIEELAARFGAPERAARPQLRWWWPGGAVDDTVLREQLQAFAEGGWGGVEVQPCRIGLPAAGPAAVHDYATPSFFQKLATLAGDAAALGMVVDVTFGSAWPFGGGTAITPELAATEVTLAITSVQGPARFSGRPQQPERPPRSGTWMAQHGGMPPEQALPPGWAERIEAQAQVVAVIALPGSAPQTAPFQGFVPMTCPDAWGHVTASGQVHASAAIDLTDRLTPDGQLDWDVPPGEWQIVVCKRFVADMVVGEGVGIGPPLVADHLHRPGFDAHAQRVGEAGWPWLAPHAGKGLRGVFVDSLELLVDLYWARDFEAEFERRRGYTVRPFLPLLLQPGWRNCFQARNGPPLFDDPEVGERVRADYRLTVSELMIERLYAPYSQWARDHGLLSRTQAHGAPADWLQVYGLADMPETEDLMGGAASHFLRVARSAAHIYGRTLTSGECFVWLHEGLAITPQQLRERADHFFAAGIQQLVAHGASYPLEHDGQPWYPFAQPEFGTVLDPQTPLWPHLRPLTDYLARCQTVLRLGRAEVPVAVLAPLDLFAHDGAAARLATPAWDTALQAAGYDWDWLNADGLMRSRWADGALITPGGHAYRALVLPGCRALRAELAQQLQALAAWGLPIVWLDHVPTRDEGWLNAQQRDAQVQQAMQAIQARGALCCPADAVGNTLQRLGVVPNIAWPEPATLRFVERRDSELRVFFVHNPGATDAAVQWPLPLGHTLERWDAWTGQRHGVTGSLTVPAGQAVIVVMRPGEALPVPVCETFAAPWHRALTGPWQVTLAGRGLHGRVIEEALQWSHLQDLSQDPERGDFAGQLHYQLHFDVTESQPNAPVLLDLGQVHAAASVQLNGGDWQPLCEAPFVIDVTAALRPGVNTLCVQVGNVPENARRDPACPSGLPVPGRRLTRVPTGLLGPVQLRSAHPHETVRWCLT